MPDQPNSLLRINNLNIHFKLGTKVIKAVDGLNLDINPGETVGLVGESGSGKTATALSILRLLNERNIYFKQGEILYQSPTLGIIDLMKVPTKTLTYIRGREISMIFQEPFSALNPIMKVGKQVSEALEAHQRGKDKGFYRLKVLGLFEQVQFPQPEIIYNSFPHELSGGQNQRILIAMAIACKPPLIIADEPTTALDVTIQTEILHLLQKLKSEINSSILFVSHDLSVISQMADRVAILKNGRLEEFQRTREIFSQPNTAYTLGLLACRPRLEIAMKRLPTLNEFNLNPKKDNVKPQTISKILAKKRFSFSAIEKKRATLSKQKNILIVEDLKNYFRKGRNLFQSSTEIKAVDGVNLHLREGEILGLVGESGSGKTTLGKSILRLIEPSGGQVFFDGQMISSLDFNQMRKIRKNMQMVFQNPYASLNPFMTAGQAIMEPMKAHGILINGSQRKERAKTLLNQVNLPLSFFDRYPHQCSGGQQQRIAIARVLALDPQFIIFDESVSSLDVSVQAQILNLINDLKESFRFSSIFISHDLSVIKFIADRVLVMKNGKIVEEGYPDVLYQNPQHAYTQKLIDSIPQADKKLMIQAS
ncbi:MAG: ABC transporter ATP-binding protein [Bacteroidetes bacterium]|nr:ABC transporter ATP-binding protein [Bacteroidota bacterium]